MRGMMEGIDGSPLRMVCKNFRKGHLLSTMKFLCWNCQGLGNPSTVRELRKLFIAKDPM